MYLSLRLQLPAKIYPSQEMNSKCGNEIISSEMNSLILCLSSFNSQILHKVFQGTQCISAKDDLLINKTIL